MGKGGGRRKMERRRVERNELYKRVGEGKKKKKKTKTKNLQNPPGERETDVKALLKPVSNRLRQFEPQPFGTKGDWLVVVELGCQKM